jgi:hypothetical protein
MRGWLYQALFCRPKSSLIRTSYRQIPGSADYLIPTRTGEFGSKLRSKIRALQQSPLRKSNPRAIGRIKSGHFGPGIPQNLSISAS